MRKLLPLGLASLLLVLTGCQDTTTTGPLVGPSFAHAAASHDFVFAMLDDFGTETTGAGGSGQADIEGGSVEVEVKAEGLIPGHDYELNVTIEPGNTFPPSSFVTFGPVTADEDGEVKFKGDIPLDPGTYRLDFFITHDHGPSTDIGDLLGLNRDLLLRCAPFTVVTIVADDKSGKSDNSAKSGKSDKSSKSGDDDT